MFKKNDETKILDAVISTLIIQKWERSGYMHGFCDGIIHARSLMKKDEPKYLEDIGKTKET
ncbi:MAG: hypothetical protein SGI96_21290 [Bacteroidota bacterium]|nr:hypothetical protein [Bacteroidota bacterium]